MRPDVVVEEAELDKSAVERFEGINRDLSGHVLETLDPKAIIQYATDDAKASGRTFKPIGKHDTPAKGHWKVALVIAPGEDYHWYRQNTDGTWSGKAGTTEATKLDASRHVIKDPEKADRGIYTQFIGYFEIGSAEK